MYFFASVKTDYAIESGGGSRDARWLECRGVDRNGYSPWNGFIVPGFIPAMVVHPVKSTNSWICWGRWINLSIHGRKSTDGRKMRGGHFDPVVKLFFPSSSFSPTFEIFEDNFYLHSSRQFSFNRIKLKDIKIFLTIQSMQLRFAAAPRVSIEGMELEREEKCGEARIRQRAGEEKGFIIEKTREEQGR